MLSRAHISLFCASTPHKKMSAAAFTLEFFPPCSLAARTRQSPTNQPANTAQPTLTHVGARNDVKVPVRLQRLGVQVGVPRRWQLVQHVRGNVRHSTPRPVRACCWRTRSGRPVRRCCRCRRRRCRRRRSGAGLARDNATAFVVTRKTSGSQEAAVHCAVKKKEKKRHDHDGIAF